MKVNSVGNLIGNTPLVSLNVLFPGIPQQVYGKLEGQNPGGSVKDRPAFNMIKMAIERGTLKQGDKLIEATSGNTGIALAMIAAQFKIPITLVMPENATPERVKTMQAYGAEVLLTPAEKTIEYSREVALEKVAQGTHTCLDQFSNTDNYNAHVKTTGPEIWDDTEGKVTHFVSSMGTTGTIMGVSRFLKSKNTSIQIVGVQPSEGARIPGIRRWSPEFVPKFYEPQRVDKIIDVSQEEATAMAMRLAQDASIFAGMSSGGAVCAVQKLLPEIPNDSIVVCIICDRGDRYLSSSMFDPNP